MSSKNKKMQGFWGKLERPIMALAPMADVTDVAFRRVIAKYGKPDVMFTEFVSADGLALAPEEGRKKLLKDLEYSESERPIVAQFFTSSLENMRKAVELAKELGFDGVDINMGCPDRSIEKQGAGAALIKNPTRARELIKVAKEASDLPVSIKTRLGYNKVELETWLQELLSEEPVAITIHARTRKEMSKVPAHWDLIKRAVEIRDASGKSTLILGNGDVVDIDDARRKCIETGCDGVMLGRAIFGNPTLFSNSSEPARTTGIVRSGGWWNKEVGERLRVLVEHTKLFEELLGGFKNFAIMKKHFKAYVKDFDGANDLRAKLMETNNATEVEEVLADFMK